MVCGDLNSVEILKSLCPSLIFYTKLRQGTKFSTKNLQMPGSDVFKLFTTPLVSHTYTPALTDDEASGAVTRDTTSNTENAATLTQTFSNPLSLCPAYQVHKCTYVCMYTRIYIRMRTN